MTYPLRCLKELETESIYFIRESYVQTKRVCLLMLHDCNSVVLSLLIKKAFFPFPIAIPIYYLEEPDAGPESITFRNTWSDRLGSPVIVEKKENNNQEQFISQFLKGISINGITTVFSGDTRVGSPSLSSQPIVRILDPNPAKSIDGPHREFGNIIQHSTDKLKWVSPLSHWTLTDLILFLHKENILLPSYLVPTKKLSIHETETLYLHPAQ